jgi:hypothetical protein
MEYKTEVGFIRRGEEADQWLIDESKKDRWLGDVSSWIRHFHELYVFVKGGKAVGFVIPRQDPDGFWRTGAVYITPSERTFGSVKKLTGDFFQHKKAFNFGIEFAQQGVAA